MGLNGAQAMVNCLKEENVSVLFGYPGAAICPFYDELLREESMRHILVRQEQNAGHAASGYARASGKVGVCVVTSGPGATNLITAIASAYQDSIPIVAITGQVRRDLLGRDVFQEADITGAVMPFIKHSYLVTSADDLPRIFKEAFHIAATGRPGPVLIDVPVDVQQEELRHAFEYPKTPNIAGYKPRIQPNVLQIKRALALLRNAKSPLIVAGGGVMSAHARKELRAFAEQANIPVTATMMGIGVLPFDHPLYAGMLGMYGLKCANSAVKKADVLLLIGARVGDRAIADPAKTSERSKIIHIDIDPAEIGKNVSVDIPIVAQARPALEALLSRLDFRCPDTWALKVAQMRAQCEEETAYCPMADSVEPRRFVRALSDAMKDKDIMVADVGQNQIWASNNYKLRDGLFITSGGMGTMGYSLPAAMGAKLAKPRRNVIAVMGDGSIQMSMMELATLVQHGIDVKIVVFRNCRLGMVRELQDKQYGGRETAVDLDGSPDFIALAAAYGIPGADVHTDGDVPAAIEQMFAARGPFLMQVHVDPSQSSYN
ncbi:MAG: biosynthetic-type acetolactate synthase large subunit [Clostridia bacterium]